MSRTLLITLVAPLPYWAMGAPWLLALAPSARWLRLAPLLGCVVAGFVGELAFIAGVSPSLVVAVGVGASGLATAALWRHTDGLAGSILREGLILYLFSAAVSAISPFPVLGLWSGDWHLLYQMGEALRSGALAPNMLARPPLFGAAAMPLWLFQDGLPAFQAMSSVASAGMAASVLMVAEALSGRTEDGRKLWPLLLSCVFLHNTAAAWGKPLAAGLVLAAIVAAFWARGTPGVRAMLWSGFFAGAAVAAHEGAIVWAPLILAIALDGRTVRKALGDLLIFGAAASVTVLPFLVWVLAKYGLAAKIAANPVVTDRNAQSLPVKTALVALTSLIGWGPVEVAVRWVRAPAPFSAAEIAKQGYWLLTSIVTTEAGTLAGFLVPVLLVRHAWLSRAWRMWPGSLQRRVWMTALVALGVSAALSPFSSPEGTLQNALLPVPLLLMATWMSGEASAADWRALTLATALTQTSFWIVLNAGISAALRYSPAFEQRFRAGSEGDYQRLLDAKLTPLGLAHFPGLAIALVGALAIGLMVERWRRALPTESSSASSVPRTTGTG